MSNQALQSRSFDQLVANGVYDASFEHADKAKNFVHEALARTVLPGAAGRTLRLLDCGCGAGTWSDFVATQLERGGASVRLCGFDISAGMIDVARERLSGRASDLRVGDLLKVDDYHFDGTDGFDVVFVYDAIQQLQPRRQAEALDNVVASLAPGGTALVFDHDGESEFGRRAARKKFITKYFFIPLVPRYYCNAKYPPLARMAAAIDARDGYSARVLSTEGFAKLALVVERS